MAAESLDEIQDQVAALSAFAAVTTGASGQKHPL